MKRRQFIQAVLGATLFPFVAYKAIAPATAALLEGTVPAHPAIKRAPKVEVVVEDWPQCQYGDYISANHPLSDWEIAEYKALCRLQAKETFEALQVPDACDKIEYIVLQATPDSSDPLLQVSKVGWKVKIPAPAWAIVLQDIPDGHAFLKQVLKTRKRLIPIGLNGHIQYVPRSIVRDYMRLFVGRT